MKKSGKKRQCDFDQIFELLCHSKTVSIVNQVKKLNDQHLHNNTGDGTRRHVQKLVELMIIFEEITSSFFGYSWFRLQSIAIHCNRRVV